MPISVFVTAVLALVDWKKVLKSLATDAVDRGTKSLLSRLKPDERERSAKRVVEIFVEEFEGELDDKTPFSAAVQGYQDQLRILIEHAAPDISACLQADTREVDLGPSERMWNGLGLDPLPEHFNWGLVATNFARGIRAYVKHTPELRELLVTALLEEQTELQRRSEESLALLAGPDPGFDLTGYREFLQEVWGAATLRDAHHHVRSPYQPLECLRCPIGPAIDSRARSPAPSTATDARGEASYRST
jgi:hypothetical protein